MDTVDELLESRVEPRLDHGYLFLSIITGHLLNGRVKLRFHERYLLIRREPDKLWI